MATRHKVQGVKIALGDGASPEVFTNIPQVVEITGLGSGEASDIDVTDFDSTGMEFMPGLKDEGTISVKLNLDPDNAVHEDLKDLRDAQTLNNFKITLTNSPATTWTFSAYVKSLSRDMASNDVLRSVMTLRISGSVTEA